MEYFKKVLLLCFWALILVLVCAVLAPVIVLSLVFCVIVLAIIILASPIFAAFGKLNGSSIAFEYVTFGLDKVKKSND